MRAMIKYNHDPDSRFGVSVYVDSVDCQEMLSDILEDSEWDYGLESWKDTHIVNTDAPLEVVAEILATLNRVTPGTIEISEDL